MCMRTLDDSMDVKNLIKDAGVMQKLYKQLNLSWTEVHVTETESEQVNTGDIHITITSLIKFQIRSAGDRSISVNLSTVKLLCRELTLIQMIFIIGAFQKFFLSTLAQTRANSCEHPDS